MSTSPTTSTTPTTAPEAPPAPKKRTITLTGRAPVTIREDQWPLIAQGGFSDHDNQYKFQANRTWDCKICVRQHEDGRMLVYGVYHYNTAFQNERNKNARAGYLLATGDSIPDAINRVAFDLFAVLGEYEDHVRQAARDCVADLPAEEI